MVNINLKLARIKCGLKQKELASMVNVTAATISRIEQGTIKNPSISLMINLSKALEVPVQELFFSEEV
jgi:putative transcriptional regulator